jgi:hypothetical protein
MLYASIGICYMLAWWYAICWHGGMLYASMVVCYMLALGIGVCRHRALLGWGIGVCSKGALGMLGVSILVIWSTYLRRFHMLGGIIGDAMREHWGML